MIRLEGATVSMGGRDILLDASLHVKPNDHTGLVGRNGSGKTTLLRALVGEALLDEGALHKRNGLRLGWLPQTAVSGSTQTVWEEAKSRMDRLNGLRAEFEAAQHAVEIGGDAQATERLDRATEAMRQAGGFAQDERIGEVLNGLGFGPEAWERSCETFSGGWQMRIALARLLLSEPDVALLDEPTNHLDLEARSWLAGFLANAPWAFVLVSHDRYLLERCLNRVVEIRHKRIREYTGSFSSFLKQRHLAEDQQSAAYDRQQREIAKLERFVERFGAKATKASQARSRQNKLDRMERIDAPEAEQRAPRIRLPEPPAGAQQAMTLIDADLGFDQETPVLQGVNLVLERGMRLSLIGPNGCGKSTLLQSLAGRLPLLAGRRQAGDRVRIGVFSQDLAATLPPDPSALDHLSEALPMIPPERIRAVLGGLGLSGDGALKPIGVLSGGERARVALAALVLRPCNLMLLDEPTNHLDVETTEMLADALIEWPGTLVLVTHDRWLVERAATHVARLSHGVVDLREGVRPTDFDREAPPESDVASEPTAGASAYAEQKKRQREADRRKKRIAEIEQALPEAEARIAALDEALIEAATDHVRATELGIERQAAADEVEALYAEWETLEADA
ncbi:MAG: ABC-F family ATP-binding cassette domain-containing protein [Myxococcota bacterium]